MPSKNGVGLYEQEGVAPVPGKRGQDDHPHAVARRELGPGDLATCDDQLLAQERVLGEKLPLRACEIPGCCDSERSAWTEPFPGHPLNSVVEPDDNSHESCNQIAKHAALLPDSSSRSTGVLGSVRNVAIIP